MVASSYIISDADLAKVTGPTTHNTVWYQGYKTVFYGTRYMVALVKSYMYEYSTVTI